MRALPLSARRSARGVGSQVGVGAEKRSVLAEVCIVNFDGDVVYHRYVKPVERVSGEAAVVLRAAAMSSSVPCRSMSMWSLMPMWPLLDSMWSSSMSMCSDVVVVDVDVRGLGGVRWLRTRLRLRRLPHVRQWRATEGPHRSGAVR
jgi:hypothetical protein